MVGTGPLWGARATTERAAPDPLGVRREDLPGLRGSEGKAAAPTAVPWVGGWPRPGTGPGEGGREGAAPTCPLCPQARMYLQSLPPMPRKDLRSVFQGANPLGEDGPRVGAGLPPRPALGWAPTCRPLPLGRPAAVDLLGRMLVLDSDQRVSAAEALAHAYFSQYHDPDDEPEAEPYDESAEEKERSVEEWKGGHGQTRGRGLRAAFPGGRASPVSRTKRPSSSLGWSGRGTACPPLQGGAGGDGVGGAGRAWGRHRAGAGRALGRCGSLLGQPRQGVGQGWVAGTRRRWAALDGGAGMSAPFPSPPQNSPTRRSSASSPRSHHSRQAAGTSSSEPRRSSRRARRPPAPVPQLPGVAPHHLPPVLGPPVCMLLPVGVCAHL